MTTRRQFVALFCVTLGVVGVAAACSEPLPTALGHLTESRRVAADLEVQFTKAAEASNRAVMAGTDESSSASGKEARDSMEAVTTGAVKLRGLLQSLQFTEEGRFLDEFDAAFKTYRELDATVLDLAIQNTNLEAQRLSFGPGAEAAETFVSAVKMLTPATTSDSWRLRATVAEAALGIREIQVLEAPHIAEADDKTMTALERRMSEIERQIRTSLDTARTLVSPATRGKVAEAVTDLDHFMAIHAELIRLSRTNSNVRSLALALGQIRNLAASCEGSLQALRTALDGRDLGPSR